MQEQMSKLLNPKMYVILSIAFMVIISFVPSTEGNTVSMLWIPAAINAVIVVPTIILLKTNDIERAIYFKKLRTFTGWFSLASMVIVNAIWIIGPYNYDLNWIVFGTWFIIIGGIIIFVIVAIITWFADNILSPENRKISRIVFLFLFMILIVFSSLFMGITVLVIRQ